MRFTFVQPASFVAEWQRLELGDADLRALESMIMENPGIGPVMAGTGGLRKLRFAPPSQHRGKSGAMRVCYVVFEEFATVYLLLIFPKNEKANLSARERNLFRQWIDFLYDHTPESEPS